MFNNPTSLFGNNAGQSLFGAPSNPQQPGLFANNTQPQTSNAFGSQPNNNLIGQQANGIFGANTTQSSNPFSAPSNSNNNIFGNSNNLNGFTNTAQIAQGQAGNMFGGQQQTAPVTSIFGSNNMASTPAFNNSSQQNGMQGLGVFGGGNNNGQSTSNGLFGNNTQPTNAQTMFGGATNLNQTQTQNNGIFGASNQGNSLFGGANNNNPSQGGLFGNMAAKNNTNPTVFSNNLTTINNQNGGMFGNTANNNPFQPNANQNQGSLFNANPTGLNPPSNNPSWLNTASTPFNNSAANTPATNIFGWGNNNSQSPALTNNIVITNNANTNNWAKTDANVAALALNQSSSQQSSFQPLKSKNVKLDGKNLVKCISALPMFEGKVKQEIRVQYILSGGQQPNLQQNNSGNNAFKTLPTGFTNGSSSNNSNIASFPSFGAGLTTTVLPNTNTNQSMFGNLNQQPNNAGSLFGQSATLQNNANTSLFPANNNGSNFGANNNGNNLNAPTLNRNNSLFGATNNNASLFAANTFGQPTQTNNMPNNATTSLFAQANTTNNASLFAPNNNSAFNQTPANGPSLFAQPATNGQSLFGQPANNGQSLFGQPASNGQSLFGQSANNGQSLFGQAATTGSLFAPNQSGSGLLNNTANPTLFAQNQPTTSLFGNVGQNATNTPTQNNGSLFATNTSCFGNNPANTLGMNSAPNINNSNNSFMTLQQQTNPNQSNLCLSSKFSQGNPLLNAQENAIFNTQQNPLVSQLMTPTLDNSFMNTSLQLVTQLARMKLDELNKKEEDTPFDRILKEGKASTANNTSYNPWTDRTQRALEQRRQNKYYDQEEELGDYNFYTPKIEDEPIYDTATNYNKLKTNKKSDRMQKSVKSNESTRYAKPLVQLQDLPNICDFEIYPTLTKLQTMTVAELKNVYDVTIFNSFGEVRFMKPISLFKKNLSECLIIRQDSVEINDVEWQSTKCEILFRNFGGFEGLNHTKRQELKVKMEKWAKKIKVEILHHNKKTGDLLVLSK